jgi:hypothetical protein
MNSNETFKKKELKMESQRFNIDLIEKKDKRAESLHYSSNPVNYQNDSELFNYASPLR